ncbi:MAG: band 7 protein, partial [Planctomycetota bacterium]
FWAEEGEIGVRKELRGPGRHFYCPIWWNRVLVDDVLIAPGQVGIVTCKLGKDLPAGQFLVDGDIGNTEYKGILRKAMTPGRYRINPYGYEIKIVDTVSEPSGVQVKHSGWVDIPAGFVGVVTNLADDPATGEKQGVQSTVLQP